ncbi:MAG: DUF6443 domain-containing protein [Bacteroidota bacterium]
MTVDRYSIPENWIIQSLGSVTLVTNQANSTSQRYLVYVDSPHLIDMGYDILQEGPGVDLTTHGLLLSKATPRPGVTPPPIPAGQPVQYINHNVNDFDYHASNLSYDFLDATSSHTVGAGWYFLELRNFQPAIFGPDVTLRIQTALKYRTFQLNTLVKYGGGIRIKEIAFSDKGAIQKRRKYNYNENHQAGSGSLGSVYDFMSSGSHELDWNSRTYTKGKDHPFITSTSPGRAVTTNIRAPQNVQYRITRDISEVLTPLVKGNYIGYKKVYVTEDGLGGELNTFISPRDVQLQNSLTSNYPFLPVADVDYKRGVLLQQEIFNEAQELLVKKEYDYHDITKVVDSVIFAFETKVGDCPWDQFYNTFDNYVAGVGIVTGNLNTDYEPSVGTCHSNGDIGTDWRKFYKGALLPKSETTTEYFYNNGGTTETSSTTYYEYNYKQRISSKTVEFNEGGQLNTYRQDYFYPFILPGSEFTSAESSVFNQMNLSNQIESPVLTKNYRNGQLTGSVKQVFREFHPDLFKLSEIKTSKQGTIEESRITYHEYDTLGNPLEVSQTSGTRISYIWGYHGMYPLAKMENVSYNLLSASNLALIGEVIEASDNDTTAATEAALRSKLTALYNTFFSSMVSTFTYDPMVGVTSNSDPRGYWNYFTYDDFYRLKFVKDAYQNIVSANEYFNRNTNDNLYNYIKSTIFQTETTTGSVAQPTDKLETMSYFDGLGRTIQTIAGRAGGQQQDVITPFEYDQWGRQTKEYLPYVNGGQTPGVSSLAYRDNQAITTVIDNYYLNKYPGDFTTGNINPYSESELEASPLSRVFRQGAPGSAWSLTNTGVNDHSIKSIYQTNKVADKIRVFRVENLNNDPLNIALTETGEYAGGELYKSITKDENWVPGQTYESEHTTEVYTDKLGRTILKRNFEANDTLNTYYIYDYYGNLTYVLSPNASGQATITQEILNDLGYQYKYDHRNRLVEKKVPGKGWEYIIYDVLDRPTLTQDANMKSNNKWLFTKYDVFSRVAYTGLYLSSLNRAEMQQIASQSQNLYEARKFTNSTGTPLYYTNSVFPNVWGTVEVLTADYYDNYNIGDQITFNPINGTAPWEGMVISLAIKGLPTVSRVRVLGTNDWITAATYYDEKGRAWETHNKNDYLKTQDWVLNKLNFVGNIERTMSMHIKGSTVTTTNDYFTYDHASRLLTHKQSINNQEQEVIVSNTYDEQGQLIQKGVGGKVSQSRLQDIDYEYNVRGWLRQINEVDNLGADLFGFKINYNQQEGLQQYENLFNGNISQTIWRTASTDPTTGVTAEKRGYSYRYDALNRITMGTKLLGDNLIIHTGYHLGSVNYDKNGNITRLQRYGQSAVVDYPYLYL